LLTFQKGRSAVSFSTRKTENTPVFYNSEALHIANTEWNTSDYGDRLAGFRMVFVNATKEKLQATDCIFIVSCARGCSNKVEFSKQSHTQTL
jgi:hypothetical protein